MGVAAMKVMKAKVTSISKGGLAAELASDKFKKSDVSKLLDSLAGIATTQVKKVGKFTIPGLVMIKTRKKEAQKAGKRMAFGKLITVKARPAKTIVKAYCVANLK